MAPFPFHASEDGESFQGEKRKAVVANCGLLHEWRNQLEKIKVEVDRVLLHVIEEMEGPGSKIRTKLSRVLECLSPKPTRACKKALKIWIAKGPLQLRKPMFKRALKQGLDPGASSSASGPSGAPIPRVSLC